MMAIKRRSLVRACSLFTFGLLLAGCTFFAPMRWGRKPGSTAPGFGERFASEGERIYLTATNEQGETISYDGGPAYGGMMMQFPLACVSCHGPDGRGGRHTMHMQIMDVPDIRYESLNSEMEEHGGGGEGVVNDGGPYDLEMFRKAVVEGQHPDRDELSTDMPRWQMNDEDLAALFDYIQSLPP